MAGLPSEGRDFFTFWSGGTNANLRAQEGDYRGGYDPSRGRNLSAGQYQQQYQAGQDLGAELQRRMMGQGPSVAEAQLARSGRATDQAVAAQAASQRGAARNTARRDAIGAIADARAQTNEAAAQLRAQEQAQAAGQYQNLIGQQQGAVMQQQGLQSAEQMAQMQADQNARMQSERFRAEQEQANQKASSDFFAGAMNTALTFMSDVRAKENVQPAGDMESRIRQALGGGGVSDGERERRLDGIESARRTMDAIRPVEYSYKPAYGGDGSREIGIRAQDAERGGADFVYQGGDGMRRIDPGKAIKFSLAGVGDLNDRQSHTEKRQSQTERRLDDLESAIKQAMTKRTEYPTPRGER